MKRALQLLIVAACFGLLVLPTAVMIAPSLGERLGQAALFGSVVTRERPALSLEGVADERFQKQLVAWFDQHYGLRPTATRIDNSLGIYLLHETRPEQPVQIGKDGVLFLNDQVGSYNRQDDPSAQIATYARSLAAAQEALAARGKFIVLMLLPSKPTIYRDAYPATWALPLGPTRRYDANYDELVRELVRVGAAFVDGRATVGRAFPPSLRDRVYSTTGRHLNTPAACLILDEALTLARPHLRDVEVPPLDCRYEMVHPDGIASEQFDLLRVANVWSGPPRNLIPRMRAVEAPAATAPRRPDTLLVSTSFGWQMIEEGERNHALGLIQMFYYNTTVMGRDGAPFYAVPQPQSDEWRALVLEKDLFLLPAPEEYMPDNSVEFLTQLLDALARP